MSDHAATIKDESAWLADYVVAEMDVEADEHRADLVAALDALVAERDEARRELDFKKAALRNCREAHLSAEAEAARWKEKRCDFAHELELARLREALLVVDEALANGDAPGVYAWHRTHREDSAEDCLVCVVRAALAPKEDG